MNNLPSGDPLSLLTPISEDYFNYTAQSDESSQQTESKGMLGKHFIVHETRYGGMGEVFLCSFAKGKNKNRPSFAMKSFQEQFFFDPVHRISFENEAVNWSRLSGLPHIMPVLSVDEIDHRIFLMLPCVDNKNGINTLRDELNAKDIPLEDKLRHFLQAIIGLMYATERFNGLIHGDIKPENMMILGNSLYVTDFGLSKTHEQLKKPDIKTSLESTLAYKAPELWEDPHLQSDKSDIYALGIILYEILAGRRPFTADTKQEWEKVHVYVVPEAIKFGRNETKFSGFMPLIMKCLAKNPGERPGHRQLFEEYNRCWEEIDILDYFMVLYNQSQIMHTFKEMQKITKQSILRGLINLERPDLALAEIENLDDEIITPEILHIKATSLSLVYRDDEAITVFEEILATNISKDLRFECLNELGLSYKRTHRFKEAERIYLDELLPITRKDQLPKILTNLGTVYLVEEKYDKVIDCLVPMLRENPEVSVAWANLGFAYAGKKDFDNAISCLKKTLAINPGFPKVQVELAGIYLQQYMPEEAYALLDLAYKQGYNTIHWLENMMIACYFTQRDDELRELVALTRSEVQAEEAEKILATVQETITEIANKHNDANADKVELQPDNETEEDDDDESAPTVSSNDQNSAASENIPFGMPFVNFRFYIDDNSYSIEFYYPTDSPDSYSKQFKKALMQAKNDPRIKAKNMRFRSTFFYFTQCPHCGIEILTNRDEGKNLSCRQCDTRFATVAQKTPGAKKLLKKCMDAVEMKIEKSSGMSILMIIQPREGDDIELLKQYFLDDGYRERNTTNNKQAYYLLSEMIKRGTFARNEAILGFDKDFSHEIIAYKDETPPEVDLLLRKIRVDFPGLRSCSAMYETNPDDIQGLILIGKYAEALVKLEDELKKNPKDFFTLFMKAYLLMDLDRLNEAISIATELLDANPNKSDAWMLMGETLLKANEFQKAIPYLEQSSKMAPLDTSSLVKLATCYKHTGNETAFRNILLKLQSMGMI